MRCQPAAKEMDGHTAWVLIRPPRRCSGCNGPFFGSRGCGLGLATLPRDGFAGYQGGTVFTAPFRVAGDSVKISADGGAAGIKVGVVGDRCGGHLPPTCQNTPAQLASLAPLSPCKVTPVASAAFD